MRRAGRIEPGRGVGATGQTGCESRERESRGLDSRVFTACGLRFCRRGMESRCCAGAEALLSSMKASPMQSARKAMSRVQCRLRRIEDNGHARQSRVMQATELTWLAAPRILPHTM